MSEQARTPTELADAYLALWQENLQAWAAEKDLDAAHLLELYAEAMKTAMANLADHAKADAPSAPEQDAEPELGPDSG